MLSINDLARVGGWRERESKRRGGVGEADGVKTRKWHATINGEENGVFLIELALSASV